MKDPIFLTAEQGQNLLDIARHTLETRIGRVEAEAPAVDPRLNEDGATFVTLSIRGALRGCIGTPEAHDSLVEDVRSNAIRAATMDPRFPPVSAKELDELEIEVSVLTPPQVLDCVPEERPDHIQPGVDGLLLVSAYRRGLLLPQVWEKIPGVEDFLDILCRKAGLKPADWRREGTRLYTFQVQAFHES